MNAMILNETALGDGWVRTTAGEGWALHADRAYMQVLLR